MGKVTLSSPSKKITAYAHCYNLPSFISKEMYFFVFFISEMIQAVRLIPTDRKDVKTYLATNGKLQVEISKLFLQQADEVLSNVMNLSENHT